MHLGFQIGPNQAVADGRKREGACPVAGRSAPVLAIRPGPARRAEAAGAHELDQTPSVVGGGKVPVAARVAIAFITSVAVGHDGVGARFQRERGRKGLEAMARFEGSGAAGSEGFAGQHDAATVAVPRPKLGRNGAVEPVRIVIEDPEFFHRDRFEHSEVHPQSSTEYLGAGSPIRHAVGDGGFPSSPADHRAAPGIEAHAQLHGGPGVFIEGSPAPPGVVNRAGGNQQEGLGVVLDQDSGYGCRTQSHSVGEVEFLGGIGREAACQRGAIRGHQGQELSALIKSEVGVELSARSVAVLARREDDQRLPSCQ